jgi:hypothetical protein
MQLYKRYAFLSRKPKEGQVKSRRFFTSLETLGATLTCIAHKPWEKTPRAVSLAFNSNFRQSRFASGSIARKSHERFASWDFRAKYWLWFAGVTNLMVQPVQPEKAYFKHDGSIPRTMIRSLALAAHSSKSGKRLHFLL